MQEGGFHGGVRLPEQEQQLRCPRCESTNTKFCYYNNYNLSQPRHFCKNCRRYWTKGGALRNIPVGGGTRKNSKRAKRPDASSSAAEEVPSAGDQIYRGEELQMLTRGGGDAAAEGWSGGGDGGGWTTGLSMYAPRFG